jgi:hypothetical protein
VGRPLKTFPQVLKGDLSRILDLLGVWFHWQVVAILTSLSLSKTMDKSNGIIVRRLREGQLQELATELEVRTLQALTQNGKPHAAFLLLEKIRVETN